MLVGMVFSAAILSVDADANSTVTEAVGGLLLEAFGGFGLGEVGGFKSS